MKTLLVATLMLLNITVALSQQQRALVIGIDQYAPPEGYTPSTNSGRLDFPNLEGCKNDALSIYSLLTSKFGFAPGDIDTLLDHAATRAGILDAMSRLLASSKAGDIAVIYAASHGSLVRNSLSFEADKLDQTMVPCDTWKEGVSDIRDKEFSKIFNDFIDKQVKLTVIFDFCHSGSISRGPNTHPGRFRFMPMANWDSKDPSKYEIPETRAGDHFLIFSAAQSDEYAEEQPDDQGIPHGAFTSALAETLSQQSVDAAARTIFSSARAIMKSNGKKQEPIIGGSQPRQGETLFGIKRGALADYSLIPVSKILGGKVQLEGGFALGLCKENELALLGSNNKDTLFKLVVDTVLGVNKSLASVIKGDIHLIKPGFQFKVTNWVSSGRPLLKIHIPRSELTETELTRLVNMAKELKASKKIHWVSSIGKGSQDPYATVFWENGKCYLKIDNAPAKEIARPTSAAILQDCHKDSSLYVELPVSKAHSEEFISKLKKIRSISLVEDPRRANYILYGRLGRNDLPAYGLRKFEIAARDSLESMPIMTDCFETLPIGSSGITDSLEDRVLKLSKLRGWLTLPVPEATRKGFGYHLVLYNDDKREPITDGRYHIGENISLKLVADSDYYNKSMARKFVYVFAVDQSGAMQLLYPEDDGNVENVYPKFDNGNLLKERTLLSSRVPPPSGTDNYFLLASDSPIQNAGQIFNQNGVYTSAQSRGAAEDPNPLSALIDLGNAGSRGDLKKLPATWSLQRLSFLCTY